VEKDFPLLLCRCAGQGAGLNNRDALAIAYPPNTSMMPLKIRVSSSD